MKQFLQKGLVALVGFMTAVAMGGMSVVAFADAGQLALASVTLSDSRPSQNANHTFSFNVASTTSIQNITFTYSTTPSGASSTPSTLGTNGTTISAFTIAGSTPTSWNTTATSQGTISLSKAAGSGTRSANDIITVTFNNLTNNAIPGGAPNCNLANGITVNANSDTCFVRITTYSDVAGTLPIDQTSISYTVVNPVTVTATIDPTLTFTVAAVNATAVTTNDGNATGTGVTSTATTCPFGNIAVGAPKVCQQDLSVKTNAQNGYKVYEKFLGSNALGGSYAGNIVSTFTGSSSTFASPQAWISPTGVVKNTNSSWIGVRTNNSGPPNFNVSNVYAPVFLGAGSGDNVMIGTGPDNGGTHTFVTYKIEANAFQPSDTYTGTAVYNVIPVY